MTSAVFFLDERNVATANGDRAVILWDLTDRNRPRRLARSFRAVVGPSNRNKH